LSFGDAALTRFASWGTHELDQRSALMIGIRWGGSRAPDLPDRHGNAGGRGNDIPLAHAAEIPGKRRLMTRHSGGPPDHASV